MTLATGGREQLFHSLRKLADALQLRRDIFSIVAVEGAYRYMQVLSDCDGSLVVEAVGATR